MVENANNPFQPGTGKQPPYRAGHEESVSLLKESLAEILGTSKGDGIVMYGPRGNGKTTLLNELRDLALEEGVTVRHLSAQALQQDVAAVCHVLYTGTIDARWPEWWARAGWWRKAVWWAKGVWRAKASLRQQAMWRARARTLSVTSAGNITFRQQTQIETVLRDLLQAPMLLLVDEAQGMPEDMGKLLLQSFQQCLGAGLPLLLVMAGTPSVTETLSATHASFWERLRKLRVGRLETEAAARDALAIPAKATGLPFDEDALDMLVKESQLYPFFVQVLGRAAWKVARKAGNERISLADAERGVEQSLGERQEFYAARAAELEKRRVIIEAKAVSVAMRDLGENPMLPNDVLDRLLSEAASFTGNSPDDVKNDLAHLGLIWRMPSLDWETGIPSLCDYLARARVGEPVGKAASWGGVQQAAEPRK